METMEMMETEIKCRPKSQPLLVISFCGVQDDGAKPWSMSIVNSLEGNYPPLVLEQVGI